MHIELDVALCNARRIRSTRCNRANPEFILAFVINIIRYFQVCSCSVFSIKHHLIGIHVAHGYIIPCSTRYRLPSRRDCIIVRPRRPCLRLRNCHRRVICQSMSCPTADKQHAHQKKCPQETVDSLHDVILLCSSTGICIFQHSPVIGFSLL